MGSPESLRKVCVLENGARHSWQLRWYPCEHSRPGIKMFLAQAEAAQELCADKPLERQKRIMEC